MRHALNTSLPHCLVQLRVNPNIGSAHSLLSEGNDGLDAAGRALLERLAVDVLVEVDSVLAGDDVLEGRARLAAGL